MPDDNLSGAPDTTSNTGHTGNLAGKRRSRRSRLKTFAALDLGTNNCRLLIARPNSANESFRVLDSYSRVVRLGTGLSSTGRLSDKSMDAAVEALTVCSKKMQARKVKRWRCVATEACRKAENGKEFVERVKQETGLKLDIISARVEARLAVMGVLNLVDNNKDVALVVDIGGGSTEISWLDIRRLKNQGEKVRIHRPPISAWASLPLGVVTLSELVPEHDDRAEWYEEMKNRVRQAITDSGCETRFTKTFKAGNGHIIGTSGTMTSLTGIYLGLPHYQRDRVDGSLMPSADAVRIARDMASKSQEERANEPCIGDDRARLLVAGCAITDVICEMWPCENLSIADRGLREGILMGLMKQNRQFNSNGSEGK